MKNKLITAFLTLATITLTAEQLTNKELLTKALKLKLFTETEVKYSPVKGGSVPRTSGQGTE